MIEKLPITSGWAQAGDSATDNKLTIIEKQIIENNGI